MQRRVRQHGDTREVIPQVTRDLVAVYGFHGTSMSKTCFIIRKMQLPCAV